MNEQNNPRGWQWGITVAIIIIILVIIGYLVFKSPETEPVPTDNTPTTPAQTEANRLIVNDQFPGNQVYISTVQLAKSGFVVIQKSSAGVPGAVIGNKLFEAGTRSGNVILTESTVDQGVYYAVLYDDTNSDGKFDSKTDQPIKNSKGEVIMDMFKALADLVGEKG